MGDTAGRLNSMLGGHDLVASDVHASGAKISLQRINRLVVYIIWGAIVNPTYHSAVVFVRDIQTSKNFYKTILGLDVEMDMGLNVILRHGVTLWQIDPKHIIAKTVGLKNANEKSNSFELCFETNDIGSMVQRIKDARVPILHDLIEEPWGQRTIRVFDPDGNIIEVGETLECFLKNLKEKGLNITQIAAKTGMKQEDVEKCLKN